MGRMLASLCLSSVLHRNKRETEWNAATGVDQWWDYLHTSQRIEPDRRSRHLSRQASAATRHSQTLTTTGYHKRDKRLGRHMNEAPQK